MAATGAFLVNEKTEKKFAMIMRTLYFLLFLFSYALIFLNFENRRFSFVFPSVLITFCFKRKLKVF
jgi:hypothetical protein